MVRIIAQIDWIEGWIGIVLFWSVIDFFFFFLFET